MFKFTYMLVAAAALCSPAVAQNAPRQNYPIYERGRDIVQRGFETYQRVKPFTDAYDGAKCLYRGTLVACGPFVAGQVVQGARRGGQVIIDSAGATQQLYRNYYNGNTWGWPQLGR